MHCSSLITVCFQRILCSRWFSADIEEETHRTLEAQVSYVQDGGQQLGDLPVLCLSEHENFHGRQDAGIITQVIAAVACCAVTLDSKKEAVSGTASNLVFLVEQRLEKDILLVS